MLFFFFFNDTATTEIYTLSLHDALPIWIDPGPGVWSMWTTAKIAWRSIGPPKYTGSRTSLDGACSGKRLESDRPVGRLRMTPTWGVCSHGTARRTAPPLSRAAGTRRAPTAPGPAR